MQTHEALLRDFDKTAALAKRFLVERYGENGADALYRDARANYREILPQVSWVKGARAPVMNAFLGVTAQEIAVYRAVKARGGTAPEAWEICHEANRLRIQAFPKWKRWLLERFMFSGLVRRIARRREQKNERVRAGDFEIRYLTSKGQDGGNDFDLGVDYVRCGNLELAKTLGAEAFAPYICMSDIVLSDALGWGLTRTQTLADGCSHCDFRFKKGGETHISSKTPEVQQTIERIRRSSRNDPNEDSKRS